VTRLVSATLAHFAWAILGVETVLSGDALRLPPGGLESRGMLDLLKQTAMDVQESLGVLGAWLIVEGDEVVGMISLKGPARDGVIEFGYGVNEHHRRRGHATRAVALTLVEAEALGLELMAETAVDNTHSQRVLERNGFQRRGERVDAVDGALLVWRRPDRGRGAALGPA
jgi:RimJ/RimL family protein N-acetyltransferase